jgi:hypothetical protein
MKNMPTKAIFPRFAMALCSVIVGVSNATLPEANRGWGRLVSNPAAASPPEERWGVFRVNQ